MQANMNYPRLRMPGQKASSKDARLQRAWTEFKITGSVEARNTLIEAYLPIVKYHADRVSARTGYKTPAEDLMTAGVFGLMDAIDAYDFGRDIKFSTFAAHRVRGAILDELRAVDWVPRLVRTRTAKVENARDRLSLELGRQPDDEELAAALQVSRQEYRKISRDVGITNQVSLQQTLNDGQSAHDRDLDAEHMLADPRQPDPLNLAQQHEVRHLVLDKLSRFERLLVELYYYEGMTMREISSTFDISESRVCQLHAQVLAKLKREMERIRFEPRLAG